ncbi:MAG: cell division protein ZapB [Candidatus Electrothrix sp. EH2]|nr:cell division protein ZapB [Candidatus Electrothrix sp. EH2]
MDNEELVRLEQLVDTLIDTYSNLKEKYHTLEERLHDTEEERELLKLELAELQEQHSAVGRRVSGLLGRVEQWKAEQSAGEGMDKEPKKQEIDISSDFSDSAASLDN